MWERVSVNEKVIGYDVASTTYKFGRVRRVCTDTTQVGRKQERSSFIIRFYLVGRVTAIGRCNSSQHSALAIRQSASKFGSTTSIASTRKLRHRKETHPRFA